MQLFDIIVALIFLCSLVAISRFSQYLTAEDRQSYNHTALGLSILAVVSLIQIYNGLGVLRAVPFVSDPLFFKLAYCIGIITGLTFLISGVTSWVPLSRSYRMYSKDKIRKLELIKKTEQLARVENRLPVIFQKTLEQMLGSYTLAKGAAFIYSHRKSQLVCVSPETTGGEGGLDYSGLVFSKSVASSFSKHCGVTPDIIIDKLPQGLSMPELMVPVMAGDSLAGLFLLWEVETSRLSDEDRINLKIAADVIGRKVNNDLLSMKVSFERGLQTWRDVINSRLDWRRDGKETLSKIVDCFRGKVAFDLFSLTIVYRGNVAQRYTLGETGGLLSESNLDFGQADSLTREVFVGRKPKYEADLEVNSAASVDNMVSKGGYRSLLLHPVTVGNSTEAIVTLASRKPGQFTSKRRRYVETLMPVLADFVAFDKHRREIGIRERRAFLVNDFVSEIRQQEDLQAIIGKAAGILSKELKSTVVRVSTVDADGAFLNSRALELKRQSRIGDSCGRVDDSVADAVSPARAGYGASHDDQPGKHRPKNHRARIDPGVRGRLEIGADCSGQSQLFERGRHKSRGYSKLGGLSVLAL